MKNIFFLLVTGLVLSVQGIAQWTERIYAPNIKTAQLYPSGNQLGYPVLSLNSSDRLELHFDDLDGNVKNYSYTYQRRYTKSLTLYLVCSFPSLDWRYGGTKPQRKPDLKLRNYCRGAVVQQTNHTHEFSADKDGKIIAKNLRGEEPAGKLHEVLDAAN